MEFKKYCSWNFRLIIGIRKFYFLIKKSVNFGKNYFFIRTLSNFLPNIFFIFRNPHLLVEPVLAERALDHVVGLGHVRTVADAEAALEVVVVFVAHVERQLVLKVQDI